MWLLEAEIAAAMESAVKAGNTISVEQQAANLAAFMDSMGSDKPRIMSVADGVATVQIKGVLTDRPNFMAYLYGGGNTTYQEIIASIAAAESDDSVKKVKFDMTSGGGSIDGLFETLAAIDAAEKPIETVVTGLSASAAFAIASKTGKITASNKATRIGSVGVVATFVVWDDEVSITSTEAPKKRPDVKTAEGQAMVREELDAIHELFVEEIADGRSQEGAAVSAETVNKNFGQGAVLLAGEAVKRGMIDAVEGRPSLKVVPKSTKSKAATGGDNIEASNMDLIELKQKHPAVYQMAFAEGSAEGVAKERDRCAAHIVMGEASGATEVAAKAIKDGTEMTALVGAEYNAAAMKRDALASSQSDSDDADAGNEGAAASEAAAEGGKDFGDKMADAFDAQTQHVAEV